MDVLMFYEHKVRELPALLELREELIRRGWKCAIYSIAFEWYSAYKHAQKNKVDILLLPWCYGADQFWRFSPFIELNPQLKLVNMHHEQITAPLTERVLLPRDEIAKNYPYHLCWAPYFRDALVKVGVDASRTAIVGNLRLKMLNRRSVERETLAAKYSLNPNKRWILFGESRRIDKVSLEKNKHDFVEQSGVPENESEAFFNRWVESMEVFMRQVKELPDSFFDRYEFIYRPHPGSTIDFDLGPYVRIIFDGPISDWLGNCDIFFTWQSTSAFEAEIAGLPVFIHECIPIPDIERMPGVSDYRKIEELGGLNDELIAAVLDEQLANPVYSKYVGTIYDDVAKRYADAIERIGETREQLESIPYDKRMIARMFFFEIMVRLLRRGDLIRKLKWPNTALMMYSDIPFGDSACIGLH